MNLAQNYNLEQLKPMVEFFQLKVSNPKILFYGPEVLSEVCSDTYKLANYIRTYPENPIEVKSIKLFIEKTTKENFYKTLKNLHKECEEEGFEVFDEKARTNARQILDFLCENFPEHDFDIYPTEDREIEIYNTPGKGRGILITCDSNGSVAYFKTDDKDSRHRCQDIKGFPFELLRKEIESLERHKILLFENPTMPPQQNGFKITGESSEYKSA